MDNLKSVDQFISQLYREAAQVPLADFSQWALDLLQQVISFDGAIWATGHVENKQFHTQCSVDVSPQIFDKLQQYLAINPIYSAITEKIGRAVDMSDVLDDETFYQSKLYKACFQPFGIERILSSVHLEQESGIFTLLTLYRYERQHKFSKEEKQQQNQLLYHLLSASSYRQFLALSENSNHSLSAICDVKGLFHAVQPDFIALINEQLTQPIKQRLPFTIDAKKRHYQLNNLHIDQLQHGELFQLSLRQLNPLDQLSKREQEVVDGICEGNTFKQIAKQLNLSPSTVSNHLYRIYLKLGINTRSELVSLVLKHSG
jgi:RNA polymerase sigma factor (sigma-70 family)